MDFTETEVAESTVLWYGKWANRELNAITTEHLFFCIAKNNEKRKEKKKWKISPHPEAIMVHLHSSHGQYHCAMSTLDNEREENRHAYYIHYKTADNSAGSSLSVG